MNLQVVIELVWRCSWGQQSSVFEDTLGGSHRLNKEMHSEIVIEAVWRWTWRPCSCELAGSNPESLEMHLEAMIE